VFRENGSFHQQYCDDPGALKDAGLFYATEQIMDLIDNGVQGIHLYTMKTLKTASRISENIQNIIAAENQMPREEKAFEIVWNLWMSGNPADMGYRGSEIPTDLESLFSVASANIGYYSTRAVFRRFPIEKTLIAFDSGHRSDSYRNIYKKHLETSNEVWLFAATVGRGRIN
jgi:hypothetical protein